MEAEVPTGSRRTVLVFLKPPLAGRVKTRLMGALTAQQAAELQAAFIEDLFGRLAGEGFDLLPVWAVPAGESLPQAPPHGLRQIEGNLGARMRHTFSELLLAAGPADSALHAIAIGGDLPHLEPARLRRGFELLEQDSDVVLGPAVDGGYYLIGLRARALAAPVFEGIDWSTEAVLAQTLDRCRSAGLAVALLPEEEDIDTADALLRFSSRLADGELAECPRTAALLGRWQGPAAASATRNEEEDACVS